MFNRRGSRVFKLICAALGIVLVGSSPTWSQASRDQVTFTQDVINVIAGNPGLALSRADLAAIFDGKTILVPAKLRGGCIKSLRYWNNDKDLTHVAFDDGTKVSSKSEVGQILIVNLKDFRERLQEAANFGHAVSFCVVSGNKMQMLNIYPCKCCKGKCCKNQGD